MISISTAEQRRTNLRCVLAVPSLGWTAVKHSDESCFTNWKANGKTGFGIIMLGEQ